MEHVSTIRLLCTCTSCLLLSDTLLHTGKAETTSLDEKGDNIVLSEPEATEDDNEQDTTLGNPQEEDLGVGDNIDTLTEAVGKMSVGGGVSTTNQTFSTDLSFPYVLYNYEAKDQKVVTVNFLVFGQNKKMFHPMSQRHRMCWNLGSISLQSLWIEDGLRKLIPTLHTTPTN